NRQHPPEQVTASSVHLSDKLDDTLEVAPETVEAMRLKVDPVKPAPRTQPITMLGQLFIEASRLNHVQTLFMGRVVEVAQIKEGDESRPLGPGDRVERDQILAKLQSKEVGQKKSELVDSI